MIDIYKILKKNERKLKASFLGQSFDTIPLIAFCVDQTTIRSFHASKEHSIKYKPLSIFRVWGQSYLLNERNLSLLLRRKNFENIRTSALRSLKKYWKGVDGGTPENYQFDKLIDLFFKFLPLWRHLEGKSRTWVFNETNVPIDKYSLKLLRDSSKDLKIPSAASMKYAKNKYTDIQTEIRKLCKDIPCLVFDLYAWNNRISNKPTEFELIPL